MLLMYVMFLWQVVRLLLLWISSIVPGLSRLMSRLFYGNGAVGLRAAVIIRTGGRLLVGVGVGLIILNGYDLYDRTFYVRNLLKTGVLTDYLRVSRVVSLGAVAMG